MEKQTGFPVSAGFLFPDGAYYATSGKSHEETAYKILRDVFGMNILDYDDPETTLQDRYSAILIRYRWEEKLVYLPKRAPATVSGCRFFKEAVEFYRKRGFQIINIYKISLEREEFIIEQFIGEEYEDIKIFSMCTNYTQTVIMGKDGKYMYNPERIGD